MSNILLIEPHKMLQHAFVLALFPDHQVEIIQELAAAKVAARRADVAIIDAVSLRQCKDAGAEVAAVDWDVPTIWIDTAAGPRPDAPEWITLTMPFSREELRASIVKLLDAASQSDASSERGQIKDRGSGGATKGGAQQAAAADKQVIDLVEVFDEAEDAGGEGAAAPSRN